MTECEELAAVIFTGLPTNHPPFSSIEHAMLAARFYLAGESETVISNVAEALLNLSNMPNLSKGESHA